MRKFFIVDYVQDDKGLRLSPAVQVKHKETGPLVERQSADPKRQLTKFQVLVNGVWLRVYHDDVVQQYYTKRGNTSGQIVEIRGK
jgi:hypothetical protein